MEDYEEYRVFYCRQCGTYLRTATAINRVTFDSNIVIECDKCGKRNVLHVKVKRIVTEYPEDVPLRHVVLVAYRGLEFGDWTVFEVPNNGTMLAGPFETTQEAVVVATDICDKDSNCVYGGIYPEHVSTLKTRETENDL